MMVVDKPIIFCDQDGVLTDFVKGVCEAHKRPSPYALPENYGIFDMERIWNITVKEFYEPTNTEDFWLNLDLMPDADLIMELLGNIDNFNNIAILTSPSDFGGCITGKRKSIKKYYPWLEKNLIFTSAKQFLAGPNRILIDDRDKNIEDFEAAGGKGILVPRLWNKDYRLSGSVIETLTERLKVINE